MASANNQSIDDFIVCLMSMGFELSDCQDAVSAGKLSVDNAVEWIIQGKPGKVTTQPSASLKLKKTPGELASSSGPFISPHTLPSNTESHDRKDGQSGDGTVSKQELDVEMEKDTKIVSRLTLSDDQRRIKEQFLKKEREAAKKDAKDDKAHEKKARAEALKRIAEDREKKKLLHGSNDGATPPKQTTPSPVSSSTSIPSSADSNKCIIQVRFPDGRTVKERFSPDDKLKSVWDFIATKHRNVNMCLIQPFPRYEFTVEDVGKTLKELRLTPSGSLVLKKAESRPLIQAPVEAPEPPADEAGEDVGPEEMEVHSWGTGNVLEPQEGHLAAEGVVGGQEGAQDADDEIEGVGGGGGMNLEAAFDPIMNPNLNPVLAGLPLPAGFGGLGLGGGGGGPPSHQWGEGVQMDDRQPDPENQQSASQRAAEAARRRYAEQPVAPPENLASASSSVSVLMHDVSSLNRLCVCQITSRICDPRNPLMTLGGIPEDVAQKLLNHLMKEKLLRFKTLQLFSSCHLQKLILDSYCYTTNELLNAVRYHTNLCQLSLRDCPLITDAGLNQVVGLHKLRSLNVSCCRLLTNKCLSTISELSNLTSLSLEGTSINDSGIQLYASSKPANLLHLNLNRSQVTQSVFIALQEIPQLKSLLLEQTQITSLTGIENLRNLETLNIAGTDVVTDSLLCLTQLPSLISLNISGTENIVGDQALKYLSGLKLQNLILPSRLSTTNVGMQYLVGMPLTSLNLTNYINISDEGVAFISKILSLKSLMLTNTKVTDAGMLYLKGLDKVEVLHLDRTLITDVGAMLLKSFKRLTELSLASSGVSSKFLVEGSLNGCYSLSKLNLSKTRVSNKGLIALRLPSLTLLNLDSTWVKQDVTELMQGCPCLQTVILHNLENVREESEEDMEAENN